MEAATAVLDRSSNNSATGLKWNSIIVFRLGYYYGKNAETDAGPRLEETSMSCTVHEIYYAVTHS
jgi:hypothetical protein